MTDRNGDEIESTVLTAFQVEVARLFFSLPAEPGRTSDLSDRGRRARVYEVVLREGTPDDIRSIIDGALLVDLWDDLVLPSAARSAWNPVIRGELVVRAV